MKTNFKKVMSAVLSVLILACALLSFTGCDTSYVVTSEFYWSSDAGATYGNGTKEYVVGENTYMKLIILAESSSCSQEEVGVTVTIPYIQDVVSKQMDGQIITPEVDELNHTTTYNFSVIASKDATQTEFVFKFIPLQATDVKITVVFDDKISSIYDKQNTVTFIEASTTEE